MRIKYSFFHVNAISISSYMYLNSMRSISMRARVTKIQNDKHICADFEPL